MKKLREIFNLFVVKNPRGAIVLLIAELNVLIVVISSVIINLLMKKSVGGIGIWKTMYYTMGMILDAGMMENIIGDVGKAGVVLVSVCLLVIVIGSVIFTGAIIGYVTNYISNFIENANSNGRSISVSNHTIILNWNSRASEIINDMLFLETKENIVVLVNDNAERVREEINERLYLTMQTEKVKNHLNVIVREGNTYSTKQLEDISIAKAKTVIILGDDDTNYICKYGTAEKKKGIKGNANTIKTLVQVSEMTSSDKSLDHQRIIVEIDDQWTEKIVSRIIEHKEKIDKCNIVPISVNHVLGQILSQFCIFPELNSVYSDLFSNKGAECFCLEAGEDAMKDENAAFNKIFSANNMAIPLSYMDTKTGKMLFYMSDKPNSIKLNNELKYNELNIQINKDYWLEKRNIIILGHNSKVKDLMSGFESFRGEWNRKDGSEILNIMVIDDKENLERQNYYKDYTYVNRIVEAEIYDTDLIKDSINTFIDENVEDTSILVLSDDMVPQNDIDSFALTNLIYVQDIIFERVKADPNYDTDRIDVIVEILNPKNYEVVHNYNIDNIVISNRYISKMVTQISEKIELFEFYNDILVYDVDSDIYVSKEIYVKPVLGFLKSVPEKCSVHDLIRTIYDKSPDDSKAILIGIARPQGEIKLFVGNHEEQEIKLTERDKLILYSNH
jgi:hypothetical protein